MNIDDFKEGVLATAFDTFVMEDICPAIENNTGNLVRNIHNFY